MIIVTDFRWGQVGFLPPPPHSWAVPKKPILNTVNEKKFYGTISSITFCKNIYFFLILLHCPTLNVGSPSCISTLKSIYALHFVLTGFILIICILYQYYMYFCIH